MVERRPAHGHQSEGAQRERERERERDSPRAMRIGTKPCVLLGEADGIVDRYAFGRAGRAGAALVVHMRLKSDRRERNGDVYVHAAVWFT